MRFAAVDRVLHNKKATRVTTGVGEPTRREGSDGDITIRNIKGKGVFIFVKYNNNWYARALFDGPAEVAVTNPGRDMQLVGWNPDQKAYTVIDTSEVFEMNFGSPGKLTLGSRKVSTSGGGTGAKGQAVFGDDTTSAGIVMLGKGSSGYSTITAGMIDNVLTPGVLRLFGGYHADASHLQIMQLGSATVQPFKFYHGAPDSPYGGILNIRECPNFNSSTELITNSQDRDISSGTINWAIYDPESTSFTYAEDTSTDDRIEITGTSSTEKQGAELGTSYFTTLVAGYTYRVSASVYSSSGSISGFNFEIGGVESGTFAISTSTTVIIKNIKATSDSPLRIYYENASTTQWFIDDISIKKIPQLSSTNDGALYVERQSAAGDGVLKFMNYNGDITALSGSSASTGYLPLSGGSMTGNLLAASSGGMDIGSASYKIGTIFCETLRADASSITIGDLQLSTTGVGSAAKLDIKAATTEGGSSYSATDLTITPQVIQSAGALRLEAATSIAIRPDYNGNTENSLVRFQYSPDLGTSYIDALTIEERGNIIPGRTRTINLGSRSKKFKTVFAKDMRLDKGTLYVGDIKLTTEGTGTNAKLVLEKAATEGGSTYSATDNTITPQIVQSSGALRLEAATNIAIRPDYNGNSSGTDYVLFQKTNDLGANYVNSLAMDEDANMNWLAASNFQVGGDTTFQLTGNGIEMAGTHYIDTQNIQSSSAILMKSNGNIAIRIDANAGSEDGTFKIQKDNVTDILSFDEACNFKIIDAVNDGNPVMQLGASDAECLHIQTMYDSGAQTLDYVQFTSKTADSGGNAGIIRFASDEGNRVDILDSGIDVQGGTISNTTGALNINASSSVAVNIDKDDSGSASTFTVKSDFDDGAGPTTCLTVTETGDTTIAGDLTVNGNDIAFDAAASTMSIAASAHDRAGEALTISAGNTTIGTTLDIAGGALTFEGGRGKGAGAGGNIVFKTANAVGSAHSPLNSLATALTISDDLSSTFTGAVKVQYDSLNYFTTTVAAEGATTLATLDAGAGTAGDLTLDADGKIIIDTASGSITLLTAGSTYTPAAASDAATKSYVDTTQYSTIIAGMNYNLTGGNFAVIQLSGATRAFNTFSGIGENTTMIAPFDGSLERIMFRSEEVAGITVIGFHKATTGTEVPSTVATTSVTIDMSGVADDTSTQFAFTSSNTFSKGDVLGFSIDPANDINDAIFTIVLKYDVTT